MLSFAIIKVSNIKLVFDSSKTVVKTKSLINSGNESFINVHL